MGETSVFIQVLQKIDYIFSVLCVKISSRFIHQQKIRLVGECSCDCDSLLLTARQHVGVMVIPLL
jgi:hypothetical protein